LKKASIFLTTGLRTNTTINGDITPLHSENVAYVFQILLPYRQVIPTDLFRGGYGLVVRRILGREGVTGVQPLLQWEGLQQQEGDRHHPDQYGDEEYHSAEEEHPELHAYGESSQ
jgi:hypothetical protein